MDHAKSIIKHFREYFISKDDVNILDTSSGSFNDNTLILDVKKGLNIVDRIKLDVPFLVAPSLTSKWVNNEAN